MADKIAGTAHHGREVVVASPVPEVIVVGGEAFRLMVSPANRSRLVEELRSLDERRLQAMQVPQAGVALVQVAVALCRTLTDEDDDRPWDERLESVFQDVDPREAQSALDVAAEFTEQHMQDAVAHIARPETLRFYLRLLGAATYDRLAQATRDDSAAILVAVQRGMKALQPMALAVQDSVSILTDKQIEATGLVDLLRSPILQVAVQVDSIITHALDVLEVGDLERLRRLDSAADEPDTEEIARFAEQLRRVLEQDLHVRVTAVNEGLDRKMRGARTALDYSEDGPSQAASSLVELIDRLLRAGVTHEDVLGWIDTYPGSRGDLTYDRNGTVAPTKRAEALYFAYGRNPAHAIDPLSLNPPMISAA